MKSGQFLQNTYRVIKMAEIIPFYRRTRTQKKNAHIVVFCVVLFCPYFCGIWIRFMNSEDALINEVTELLGSIMEGSFFVLFSVMSRKRDQHERSWKNSYGKGTKEVVNIEGLQDSSCKQGCCTKPCWNRGDNLRVWYLIYLRIYKIIVYDLF